MAGERRNAAAPRPWWRQGRVWFAVIVLEAVGALVVSLVFAPASTDVSIDGMSDRFCADVLSFRQAAMTPAQVEADSAAGVFERQANAYRTLAGSAPTDVRRDFDELARLTDEVAATARDASAGSDRAAALDTILRKQREEAERATRADRRVRAAVLEACGIDIDTPPSTSPVTGAPALTGPSPTTPSSTTP